MNQEDFEAFAQFLNMNNANGKTQHTSLMDDFRFKLGISVSLFMSAIFCFRNFGQSLA